MYVDIIRMLAIVTITLTFKKACLRTAASFDDETLKQKYQEGIEVGQESWISLKIPYYRIYFGAISAEYYRRFGHK